VDARFGGAHQHDVFEFFEGLLDKARAAELAAGRYGIWGHVQVTTPAATHVDRLFAFVREVRRRCVVCRGHVQSWFSSECVLRVTPKAMPGGPVTVAEMYLDSCVPQSEERDCALCGTRTDHESQSRILTEPNVLVVQVRRLPKANGELERLPVSVEEELSLPGVPAMRLLGVVYHNGVTLNCGHYTCLCRGPAGGFWFYDDSNSVHRVDKEVAHTKQKEVYMVVYCRSDGSARWWRGDAVGGAELDVANPTAGMRGSAGQEGGVISVDGGGVGREGPEAVVDAKTPAKRRLVRKSSVAEYVQVRTPADGDVMQDHGGASPLSSPCRRVRRKTTVAANTMPTPERATPSRRLRRKTSLGAEFQVDSPDAASRPAPVTTSAEAPTPALAVAAEELPCMRDDWGDGSARVAAGRGRRRVMGETAEATECRGPASGRGGGGASRSSRRGCATYEVPGPERDPPLRRSARLVSRATADPVLESVLPGGAHARSGAVRAGRRPRIVTGFGAERIDDVAEDERRRVVEGARRGSRQVADGSRGSLMTFGGEELDRSAGGPWQAGRR
jgi:hypothetical protein